MKRTLPLAARDGQPTSFLDETIVYVVNFEVSTYLPVLTFLFSLTIRCTLRSDTPVIAATRFWTMVRGTKITSSLRSRLWNDITLLISSRDWFCIREPWNLFLHVIFEKFRLVILFYFCFEKLTSKRIGRAFDAFVVITCHL